jgi:uncharacterized membrane protein HdeD (DUF308 family)
MTEPEHKAEMVMADEMNLFPWWLVLLWGVLSLVVGLMFFITPMRTVEFLITVIGAYWFLGGCITLGSLLVDKSRRGWKIFLAAINIFAGLLVLAYPLFSTVFVMAFFIIFIGFWGLFIGSAHIYQAFLLKDAGMGVLGVISLVFGAILLFFPLVGAFFVPMIVGVFALASGISAIIASFNAKRDLCYRAG